MLFNMFVLVKWHRPRCRRSARELGVSGTVDGGERQTRGLGQAHEQRRAEIADGVLRVIAERGLEAVSIVEVAAASGVSPGRVQHYFSSRRELLAAAFDRGNAVNEQRIGRRIADLPPDAPARSALTVLLAELLPYDRDVTAHLRVRRTYVAMGLADDLIARRLREEYARLHGAVAGLLARDQAAGLVRTAVEPRSAAARLVAQVEGLTDHVLIGVVAVERAGGLVRAAIEELYV